MEKEIKKDTIAIEAKNKEENNISGNTIDIPLHSKYQLKEISTRRIKINYPKIFRKRPICRFNIIQ